VTILQDLDKARSEASEVEAELTKAQERVKQSNLLAPIDGTVQQLAVHTIGGVVTPAQPLLQVVPDQGKLLVEALVQNRDVGFIHAGQLARVKVETFNFTRYGLIDGRVIDVARDAVSPGDNAKRATKADAASEDDSTGDTGLGDGGGQTPAYVAHIALDSDSLVTEDGPTRLGPGMQVAVEIQTGRRRVIDYLLSPLVSHVSESFRER